MAEIIDWETIADKRTISASEGIRSLRMAGGNTYIIRFVGNPIKFFKYYLKNRSAICNDPKTCPVQAKYGFEPTLRYAANILDRDEIDPMQRPKIIEVAPSVLKPMAKWARARNKNPGGHDGCDFNITVQGRGKSTLYMVTALDVMLFTAEEREYIPQNSYDLLRLYKAVPADEIEQRLGLTHRTKPEIEPSRKKSPRRQ
jgi:hypothetical protein